MLQLELSRALLLLSFLGAAEVSAQKPARGRAPAGQEKAAAQELKGLPDLRKASNLLGAKPSNQKGEPIGVIADLLFDPRNGRLEFAVFGGHAAPFGRLKSRMSEGEDGEKKRSFFLATTPEKIASAPRLPDSMQQDFSEWSAEVHAHYGSKALPYSTYDRALARQAKEAAALLHEGLHLYKLKWLLEREVKNKNGGVAGQIKEVVVDLQHRRFAYVVLGREDFARQIAIPWSLLQISWAEGELQLGVSATGEQLLAAPEFVASDWEGMSSPAFFTQTHAHFGVTPYVDASLIDGAQGAEKRGKFGGRRRLGKDEKLKEKKADEGEKKGKGNKDKDRER